MNRRQVEHVGAVVVAVVTIGIVLSGVYVLTFGDGHKRLDPGVEGYDLVELCPSAQSHRESFVDAERGYLEVCVPVPPLADSRCSKPPRPGVAQVRASTDILTSHPAPVVGDSVDAIHHHADGSAVAYLLPDRVRDCTAAHVLGELAGYRSADGNRHDTAATSVMHDPCGPSFAPLDRCPEPKDGIQ